MTYEITERVALRLRQYSVRLFFCNVERRVVGIRPFTGDNGVNRVPDHFFAAPYIFAVRLFQIIGEYTCRGFCCFNVFRLVFRNFNLLIIDFNYAKRQEISYGY